MNRRVFNQGTELAADFGQYDRWRGSVAANFSLAHRIRQGKFAT